MLDKIKKIWSPLLFPVILWLMVWGGYNANFWRITASDFPYSFLDLFQGLRAFLPLAATILGILFFVIKKRILPEGFFLTPLGLFSLYAIVGIIASIFSTDPVWALYWGLMYMCAIVVVSVFSYSQDSQKNLSLIINTNWVIAGVLTLFLIVFFFTHQGTIQSLTYNFLVCKDRPYEGLGIRAETNTFGMAGTRPTGLARYAGVFVLIAFWKFLSEKRKWKILWLLLFVTSLCILLFSRGKTELVAFIAALVVMLWLYKKFKTFWVFLLAAVILISGSVIFYSIPCSNDMSLMFPFANKIVYYFSHPVDSGQLAITQPPQNTPAPQIEPTPKPPELSLPPPPVVIKPEPAHLPPPPPKPVPPESSVQVITKKSTQQLSTLSGRASITWPAAWQLFLSRPLTGYGFQADRFFLNGQHAHNTLLHVLVQAGLFGAIPFFAALIYTMAYLYYLFRNPRVDKKQKLFLAQITVVLVFLMVRGIMESFAFYSADWLFIIPIIGYIQIVYFSQKNAS